MNNEEKQVSATTQDAAQTEQQIQTQVLQELLHTQRRQLTIMRVVAVLCAMLVLMAVVTFALLVPRTMEVLQQVQTVCDTLEKVNFTSLVSDLDGLVKDVQPGLTDTLNALSGLDLEALNSAIKDLQSVVAPLAALFGK